MYCNLFGRCRPPYFGTCNQSNRFSCPQGNTAGQCTRHGDSGGSCSGSGKRSGGNTLIKSSALGGLVLSDGAEREAAYHVASLNLDTSGRKAFLVRLSFSCNIIAGQTRLLLRFQLFKQENCQTFSTPVSAGMLYSRESEGMEANTFTLSACDCDSKSSACCNYSVYVKVLTFEAGGVGLIANPVLIATIMEKN